jgi:transcriptional regulator with XRE-family HTH domain
MKQPCRGTEQLREFVAPKPRTMSQKKLAQLLGVSQQAVSQWVAGVVNPGAANQAKLEQLAKIPRNAWLTDDELAEVADLSAG